jgi:hypothetical protein
MCRLFIDIEVSFSDSSRIFFVVSSRASTVISRLHIKEDVNQVEMALSWGSKRKRACQRRLGNEWRRMVKT